MIRFPRDGLSRKCERFLLNSKPKIYSNIAQSSTHTKMHTNDIKRAECLGRLLAIARMLDDDIELLTHDQLIARARYGAQVGREIHEQLTQMEKEVAE